MCQDIILERYEGEPLSDERKEELAAQKNETSDETNITRSKPDPEVFLKGAEFLGEDPADCLVVEDAEAGIDAGIAGGMKTAAIGDAVNYGKADYNMSTFSDLLKILI